MKITKIGETEDGPTAIDTPKTPIDRNKDILKTVSRFVGMSGSRDAERIFDLARKTLAKNPIAPFEFNAALGGLMAVGELVGIWPALVERAYENIPQDKRIFVRSSITEFYYCMGNFEKAASLLPSNPSTESELCLAMRVFVALKKFDEADEIARLCRQAVIKAGRLLQPPQPPGENPRIFLARSCVELRQALEHYYLAMGLWHDAATIWKFVPSDPLSDETEPHIRLARIHALQALVEVQRGLDEIERKRREIAVDAEALDDESYLARWENELKNYEALLRQIVPPENLWRVERASAASPRPMGIWK